ncbi:MAG: c-type cytochrome domain-containing protein [Verrucomicrobiales bacterium]
MKSLSILSLASLLLVATANAELPVADLKRDKPVDFATEVYPFLKANCLACHNSTKAKADLILESPKHMLEGGDTGPAIEPGNGERSFLFGTAAHIEEPTMPPKNNKSKAENLTPEQLALLRQWIDEGAKGDSVSTAAPESWTLLTGPQPIYTAAISADGRFAAAGRGQKIDIYDLRLGKLVAGMQDPSLQHPTAHRDAVQSLAFNLDGTLASGGYRTVKIWNRAGAAAGDPLDLPDESTSLAASPDGKVKAVGTKAGSIVIVRGSEQETLKAHSGPVNGLVFSADGKHLFSVSDDKTVQRRPLADPAKATSLKLPAEATALALVNKGRHLAIGGKDHALRLCSVDLKSPVQAPAAPKPTPEPDEKAEASKPKPATPEPKPDAPKPKSDAPKPKPEASKPKADSPDKPKPNAPKPKADADKPKPDAAKAPAKPSPPNPPTSIEFKIHPQPVVALEPANAEGTEFLAGYADGTVVHLKLNPAKLEAAPVEVRRIAHGAAMNQIAVSLDAADGPRLATAGPAGPVNLWNLADGKKLAELKGDPSTPARIQALKQEGAVATRLKTHWDKMVPEAEKLWKDESEKAREAGEEIAKARRELAAKRRLLFDLEGAIPPAKEEDLSTAREDIAAAERTLNGAIRNRDSSARLAGDAFAREAAAKSSALEAESLASAIQTESEALQKADQEAAAKIASTALAFLSDGSGLVQALDGGGLRLWSAADGAWLEDVDAATGVKQVAAGSNGGISTADEDKKLIPWTLPGKKWTLTKTLGDGIEADPFEDRVAALAFGPHGNRLVTGTGVPSRSGRIAVWDTKTWELLARSDEAHADTVTAFAFSPDGDRVASASTDKLIKIHETDTLEHVRTLEGHTAHVLDLDWNADNLKLASAGADPEVKIWDLTQGQQSGNVQGFDKEVSSVQYVGRSDTVLTASGDESLKLANQPLPGPGTFFHAAAASADGENIVAGGKDGVLRWWKASTKKLVKEFPPPGSAEAKVAAD